MINGCLQTLATGLIPGNDNAGNIDEALRSYSHLTFPNLLFRQSDSRSSLLHHLGLDKGSSGCRGAPDLFICNVKSGRLSRV